MNLFFSFDKEGAKSRYLTRMFLVIILTNLLINIDHGIMPACTKELMADAGINELQLGILGSIVFAGLMTGSVSAGIFFQKFSARKLISMAIIGNLVAILLFPHANGLVELGICRFITGYFQVFMVIYFPVWIDLYAGEKKTQWLTYLMICVPLGGFLGYGITAILVEYFTWEYSFYLVGLSYIPCAVAFLMFKEKYTATKKNTQNVEAGSSEGIAPLEEYFLSFEQTDSLFNDEFELYNQKEKKHKGVNIMDEDDEMELKPGFKENLKVVWNRKVFRYSMLSLSVVYFVVTGIQFWISDYMRTVLEVEARDVFIAFASMIITAPVLGVVIGGNILSKLGGYTSRHSVDYAMICGALSSVFGLPVPMLSDFVLVCVLLWFFLFFGAAMMPALQGIMISSIPKSLRATGQSIGQIFQNLIGYMPAPALYGFVVNMTGGKKSRMGLVFLMLWSLWGVVGLGLARRAKSEILRQMGDTGNEKRDVEGSKPDVPEPKVEIPVEVKFERKGRHQNTKGDIEMKNLERNAVSKFNQLNRGSSFIDKEKVERLNMMYARSGLVDSAGKSNLRK